MQRIPLRSGRLVPVVLGRIGAALALAAFAHIASAQVLWQTFTTGMPFTEVRGALPAAELVDEPGAVLKSGARSKLRIPDIEIVGKSFAADFYFIDDRLTDVHLAHKETQEPSLGRTTYNDLLTALRSKYGNELRQESSGGLGWNGTATWASGGTTVTLTAFLIGRSTFIKVAYSSRLSKEAGKL